MWEVASGLGISREDAELAVQYLKGEHLLEFRSMGGYIAITHNGVLEVERALSEPEQSTQYFPPVINVMNIGSVHGSNIQQAGSPSVVSATVEGHDVEVLRTLVASLRASLVELNHATGRSSELEGMVATLEAQIRTASPNPTIVREADDC
jgi:hypothetical protein